MKIFIDNLHVKAILYMDKKLRKSVEGILSDTTSEISWKLNFQLISPILLKYTLNKSIQATYKHILISQSYLLK